MEYYKFAGFRILEFSSGSRQLIREVAKALEGHKDEIIDEWIRSQFSAWKPPGFTRASLRKVFGNIFENMLNRMRNGQLEECISDLENSGAVLANKNFPYEALIMSFHFLEESYMPFLIDKVEKDKSTSKNKSKKETEILLSDIGASEILIAMDEFIHVALAAIATSYFEVYRKQLLEEAEVARIIQEGLLPDIPKRVSDLEVGYVYLPALGRGQVGGDFLDVFESSENQFCFVIGDVSGHGLEGAADSVFIRSLFRGFIREELNIERAVKRVNSVLSSEFKTGTFATAIVAIYDGQGNLDIVNAGHPYPFICDSRCNFVEQSGVALAIDELSDYSSKKVHIKKGSFLVIYTDGLTEARKDGELLGEKKVREIIKSLKHAPARAIAEQLRDEALRFSGGSLIDDVAILVLKRH